MGRRRKRYKKLQLLRPPRRLPTMFDCPHCGTRSMHVEIDKKQKNEQGAVLARIKCGHCGLYAEMWVPEIFQQVDVYSKFLDAYLKGEASYTFTKQVEATQALEEIMAAAQAGEEETEEKEEGM